MKAAAKATKEAGSPVSASSRLPVEVRRAADPLGTPAWLLHLQRRYGNRLVGRMIQAKLAISQPGDPYEREADRVADAVMRMPAPAVQRKCAACAAGGSCPMCEDEEKGILQRAAHASDSAVPVSVPHSFARELGPGQALDSATRAFLEPRFGANFSGVRVHSDARAAAAARALKARAFTVGRDVAFADGQYRPHTAVGQRLMAHEIAHVIQQSSQGLRADRDFLPSSPITDTPANFCRSYRNNSEARLVHDSMVALFLPTITSVFGSEVGNLWAIYLDPRAGRRRRVFASPASEIVEGFVNSETTQERQRELVSEILRRLPRNCPRLSPNVWTAIPVRGLLPRSELNFPINFNHFLEIPGNIAGGVSGSSFGRDSREVSGQVRFFRTVDPAGNTSRVQMRTNFRFRILDTIDFCPGGPGAGIEQNLTIPLSRLERSGFARDVPFEVRYEAPPVEEMLNAAIIKRCWPPRRSTSKPKAGAGSSASIFLPGTTEPEASERSYLPEEGIDFEFA